MVVKVLFAAKLSLIAPTSTEEILEQVTSRVKEYAVESTLSTLHIRVAISSIINLTEKESVCRLALNATKSASRS